MAAVIFSGSAVRALKYALELFDGSSVRSGTADPTAVAQPGNKGSLYLRFGGAGGAVYKKTDDGTSTNWVELATSAGGFDSMRFVVTGLIATTHTRIDGFHVAQAAKSVTGVTVTAGNSGSGTTTVRVNRNAVGPSGAGSATANLVGNSATKSTDTVVALALVDGDIIDLDLTAVASGLEDLTVELYFS